MLPRLGMQCDGHDDEKRLLYKKRGENKRKCSKRGKEKATDENKTKPIPTLRTPRGDCTNKKMKRKKERVEKVRGYEKFLKNTGYR